MLNISVIIPVYNAAAFLEKAVASALQFAEVKEILLIEDQSTDNSLKICQDLASENTRIKLLQHPDKGNHGAGASRNLGLKMASQEFIAFLDADDYYLPNRFEAEQKLFLKDQIEGVFGAIGMEFLSEKGKEEFQKKFKDQSLTTVKYTAEGQDVFNGLLGLNKFTFGTFFHLNTLTVRSLSLAKNYLYFNENLKVHQDSDFIIKLAFHCHLKTGNIEKAIAIRGVHDNNRITKIENYSVLYNERQLLLWESLYEWSKFVKVNDSAQEIFYLNKSAFQISKMKFPIKWIQFLKVLLKNRKILKMKYRFNFLKM